VTPTESQQKFPPKREIREQSAEVVVNGVSQIFESVRKLEGVSTVKPENFLQLTRRELPKSGN
jgi:hypothetical protein